MYITQCTHDLKVCMSIVTHVFETHNHEVHSRLCGMNTNVADSLYSFQDIFELQTHM